MAQTARSPLASALEASWAYLSALKPFSTSSVSSQTPLCSVLAQIAKIKTSGGKGEALPARRPPVHAVAPVEVERVVREVALVVGLGGALGAGRVGAGDVAFVDP